VENDRDHFKALSQIGIIFLEKHDFERAASYLKKCLNINPKYVTGMVAMGNLLFESGHPEKSAKYFQ
jgi:Tfp pilus assembly protein PilF